MSKVKHHRLMMGIAQEAAKQSTDSNTKVGAVLCNGDQVLGIGYNGTLSGFDNNCKDDKGNTLSTVVHAEINALAKVARSTQSSEGSALYTTLAPCIHCVLSLVQSGIQEVYYLDRKTHYNGIPILLEAGIKVYQLENEEQGCTETLLPRKE